MTQQVDGEVREDQGHGIVWGWGGVGCGVAVCRPRVMSDWVTYEVQDDTTCVPKGWGTGSRFGVGPLLLLPHNLV